MSESKFNESAIDFKSGENRLLGIISHGGGTGHTGVIILVGGPQYRVGSHRMFVSVARHLADQAIPVLRFDFTGMGDSEGVFPGFENLNHDVFAAIERFATECPAVERYVLLGLCDGATAAAFFGATDSRVEGLILLNPWVHTTVGEARAYIRSYYPRRLLQKDFWVSLVSGDVDIWQSFTDLVAKLMRVVRGRPTEKAADVSDYVTRMRVSLDQFPGNIMIVTCDNDLTASEFTDLVKTDRSWTKTTVRVHWLRLEDADHTLSSHASLRHFCVSITEWIQNSFK